MKRFLLAVVFILAACGQSGAENTNTGASVSSPPSIAVGEPHPQAPSMPEETTCAHQDLVGMKMKDVDLKKIKGITRVLYPNSPATMDYNPDRLNIILEEGTDIILEVRCG